MRFVFLSYNYSPDIHSPQQWLERVKIFVGSAECLAREHAVFRVDQVNYTGNFSHNGVYYYCLDAGKKKNLFPRKLHGFVKSLQPDIVIVSGLYFPLQVLQLRMKLGSRIKIVVQNHAERPFTGLKKYLQRVADHFIDAYFFASRDAGEDWVKNGNLAHIDKVHEIMEVSSVFQPIDKTSARSRTGIKGEPVFLWAGRLNDNKDPLTVVRAFLQFRKLQPAAHLYMIYQTTELLTAINALLNNEPRSDEAVHLVGKVLHADMLYWYNSANYLISGSHYEGSGTAVCEAMSCGCVPLITDIPSFRAMTGNGRCGMLYKAGDDNALLNTLQATIQIDLADQQKKTIEYFQIHLSFEAIACKIQEVVGSL
jgi:glycosyltransferase involved in cell wall biosynthesis